MDKFFVVVEKFATSGINDLIKSMVLGLGIFAITVSIMAIFYFVIKIFGAPGLFSLIVLIAVWALGQFVLVNIKNEVKHRR